MSRSAQPTTYRDPVVAAPSTAARSVLYHREHDARELQAACTAAMGDATRLERVMAEQYAGLRPCPECFPPEEDTMQSNTTETDDASHADQEGAA